MVSSESGWAEDPNIALKNSLSFECKTAVAMIEKNVIIPIKGIAG